MRVSMNEESLSVHRSLTDAISEPPPALTNASRGRFTRSEQAKDDLEATLSGCCIYRDLEKGINTETRQPKPSSTPSVVTTRSFVPTYKASKAEKIATRRLSALRCRVHLFIDRHYTTYRQIFTLIFAVNLAILIALVVVYEGSPSPSSAADAAAVNLAVGVLFRQEQVVNTLFQILTSIPLSWPLWIRGGVAKVFHYGGMHSGCGVAAVAWFLLYTALATKAYVELPDNGNREALATAWILVALFVLLLGSAYPGFRVRYHNLFEVSHRFAGWAALAVFWAHVLFVAHATGQQTGAPMGAVLVRSVPFWCILAATIPVVASWAQLRKRTVRVEPLSDHATRLHFDYANMSPCFGIRVSTNPLLEWHSFATIPNTTADRSWDAGSTSSSDPTVTRTDSLVSSARTSSTLSRTPPVQVSLPSRGFSLIVSNAGDWTQRTIRAPPRTLWTRGSPVCGVIYGARLFSRVVIVATGSGIGPCLSLLVAHGHLLPAPPRVLWSARDPLPTFGARLVDAVHRADPDAVIWDTKLQGRPDLCRLAYNLAQESNAEAVFVISNPRVCLAVTTGLQERGVRAYAPIFDS